MTRRCARCGDPLHADRAFCPSCAVVVTEQRTPNGCGNCDGLGFVRLLKFGGQPSIEPCPECRDTAALLPSFDDLPASGRDLRTYHSA